MKDSEKKADYKLPLKCIIFFWKPVYLPDKFAPSVLSNTKQCEFN